MANPADLNSLSSLNPRWTYLQFCEEELQPARIDSFQAESESWKGAAITQTAGYSMLIVISLLFTAVYLYPLLPISGISFCLLLREVGENYHRCIKESRIALARADQLKKIQGHYQNLQGTTPAQIQQILTQRGIPYVVGMGENDSRLPSLKPLIARLLFWEGHIEKLQRERSEVELTASQLIDVDFLQRNQKRVNELKGRVLELENQILVSKVKNAFIHAVIHQPNFSGTLEDIGTFSNLSGRQRAKALAANHPGADDFFTFKNPRAPKITYSQAKQYTAAQLATLHLYNPLNNAH